MKKNWKKIIKGLLALLIPTAIFYLFEFYTHNPFADIRLGIQLFNILFFELVMILIYSMIGRLHIALFLETLVFMIYGLVNYFVLSFRSEPIQPWDFLSIKTAASVAGDFKYSVNKQVIFTLIGFILLIIIEFLFCRNNLKNTVSKFYKGPLKSWAIRIPAVTLSLGLLLGFVSLLHNEDFVEQKIQMYDKLFTPTVMSNKDGTAMAFLLGLQYMDVEKPSGYDKEEAEFLLGIVSDIEEQNSSRDDSDISINKENDTVKDFNLEDAPNIIVIMDEAFSDLSILGDFNTNMDYMPFMHRMQQGCDNTITGTLHVSVKGGNTANTEFEFLTGNSMAFLPQGSIPYQQYITDELPSIASYLKNLGYETRAAHPYYASGWERETVYPLLGFQQADFKNSFPTATKLRKYIDDQSAFQHIMECFKRKKEFSPIFYFEVTMQNHSGYTEEFDNFKPDITIDSINSTSLSQYLSLVKKTDEALEDFITYFADQDEKTIVVFFGDHQPADYVVEPIWNLNGKTSSKLTMEEEASRYEVPFLIWANYDITEKQNEEISANYLAGYVLELAGIQLPVYQEQLMALFEQIPVISAQSVKTRDGSLSTPEKFIDEMKDSEDESVLTIMKQYKKYQNMQYYLMFDYK